MKVAIITSTFKPELNGVAEAQYMRLQELSKLKNIEILLLVPDYSAIKEIVPDYKEYVGNILSNINVVTYPSYMPKIRIIKKDARLIVPFWKFSIDHVLEKFKPDIIHVDEPERLFGVRIMDGYMRRIGVKYARKNHIPIFSMCHTDYYKYAEHYITFKPSIPISKFLFKKILKFVYNSYDMTICSSLELQKKLTSFGVNNLYYMNSLGVDLKNFRSSAVNNKKSTTDLIFVGRISPEKNIALLIASFLKNYEFNPSCLLHIIGEGPSLEILRTTYSKYKNIIFYGKINHIDLPSYYSMGDVFINPSDSETFGMVNVEAAACSLPIIAAEDGGNLEVVKDGFNGFLFRSGDIDDLSNKIQKLLSSPELMKKFAINSRKISENYSLNEVGMNFFNIWNKKIEPN